MWHRIEEHGFSFSYNYELKSRGADIVNFRARIQDWTVSHGAFTRPFSVLLVSKCSRPLELGTVVVVVVVVITSVTVDAMELVNIRGDKEHRGMAPRMPDMELARQR